MLMVLFIGPDATPQALTELMTELAERNDSKEYENTEGRRFLYVK